MFDERLSYWMRAAPLVVKSSFDTDGTVSNLAKLVANLSASDQDNAEKAGGGATKQLVFSSPQAAWEALLLAFKGIDEKALLDVFGHDHERLIVVTDKIERDDELTRLYEAA